MRITGEMILSDFGTKLPLDQRRKDALAAYARKGAWAAEARSAQRWVEKTWDLKDYEAKDLLKGNSSEAVYERILKHPNGGFDVGLAVLTAVVGQSLESWLNKRLAAEHERLENERRRYEAQERQLLKVAGQIGAVVSIRDCDPSEHRSWSPELLDEPSRTLGGEEAGDDLAPPIQFVRRRP